MGGRNLKGGVGSKQVMRFAVRLVRPQSDERGSSPNAAADSLDLGINKGSG